MCAPRWPGPASAPARSQAQAETRFVQRQGGWQWAPDAPLAGRVTARLPQLGVWSMLAPPGWRVAGTLDADATLSGNRAAPRWSGRLAADQLSLRAAVEGLDLRDGRLRATLEGDRLAVSEFSLRGGAGSSVRIPGRGGNRSTAREQAQSDGGASTPAARCAGAHRRPTTPRACA